jgi:hypothetical protein
VNIASLPAHRVFGFAIRRAPRVRRVATDRDGCVRRAHLGIVVKPSDSRDAKRSGHLAARARCYHERRAGKSAAAAGLATRDLLVGVGNAAVSVDICTAPWPRPSTADRARVFCGARDSSEPSRPSSVAAHGVRGRFVWMFSRSSRRESPGPRSVARVVDGIVLALV